MKYAMLAAIALVLSFSPALAQSKVAYIDSDKVMDSIPQVERSSAKLEAEFKDTYAEIDRIEQDLRYNMDKRLRQSPFMTKEELDDLERLIADLRNDFDRKTRAMQTKKNKRRLEEFENLRNVIRAATEAERVARGYDMVISSESVIAAGPLHDLTAPVTARLQAQE